MKNYGTPSVLVPQMRDMISRGESFWLVVTGNSMFPTLKHLRDRVLISPFDGKTKKGDILLTEFRENHCLLHRVIKCDTNVVYYNGDAHTKCEGPLPVSDVIGIVTKFERNGRIISVNDLHYRLWVILWRPTIKFRRFAFRVYKKIKRIVKWKTHQKT